MRSASMRSHRPSAARSMNMKRPDRLHSLESVRSRCIWPAFLHCAAAGGVRLWHGVFCAWCVFGLRGSVAVFALGSRLLFAAWRQTGWLAISCVSIPPGRDRHSRVLAALARLSALAGSLRVWPFLAGDPDGLPGTRRAENGKRGWRRSTHALCAIILALQCFPRGVRWGCAPQTAPKSRMWKRHCRLSGLSSGAGRVREYVSRSGAGVVRV